MKTFRDTLYGSETKLAAFLEKGDQKSANRLYEYCKKALEANYDAGKVAQLRQQYSDVV